MNIAFNIAAIVAIICTIMVVTRYNIMHALLYLVTSFMAVAVIFFTYGAPFIAALELIVYAGAIMVLMVFVIMMLNLGGESAGEEKKWLRPRRSEEHTSELQSLMRISYAVFCLKKKNKKTKHHTNTN